MSKEQFHGTWAGYVYAIMTRGFELGHDGSGNLRGRGVYIAQEIGSAALWTCQEDIVIRCRLQPGSRILWMDGSYDQRVINSLRREFGQELLDLGPHFYKAIPHNKQLTRQELFHLSNYILMRPGRRRGPKRRKADFRGTWQRLSRLHEQFKRHGYDALGDRSFADWDSDEVIVFNPARVIPVCAHKVLRSGDDFQETYALSRPIDLETLRLISEKAQEEEE